MSTSSRFSSRTESNTISSRLGSLKTYSRPGSSKSGSPLGSGRVSSRPGSSRVSSRPNSGVTDSRPGSSKTISRPGNTKTISHTGSAKTLSRPGSSNYSSRPLSVKSGTRPVSTKSVRLDGQTDTEYHDYDSECDLFPSAGSSISDYETEEGRISRVIQDWMSDYVVQGIEPRERVKREPTYSARLGKEPRIKRSPSDETIATQLSLMSCSTNGKKKQTVRRRRRKKKVENVASNVQSVSKWIALASRKMGALDRMMKTQSAQAIGLPATENSIFDMLEKDEQKMMFNCGMTRGLHLTSGMKKSGSTTDVRDEVKPARRRRASEGETRVHGQLDFEEIRQQVIKQKLAKQAKQQMILARQSSKASLKKKTRAGRINLRRISSSSALSLASDISVNVSLETKAPPASKKEPEVKTTMWAGDQKILEIDLNRELTSKVKGKILTTTRALTRVTGYGDDNGLRSTVGTLEEYPRLTDEDYGYMPKIVQRVRISPHLSRVIHHDIKVRMGRPRYHEISEQDVAMWNRGQKLDRTHRNLKVFNWLHSLREEEFDYIYTEVDDRPPSGRSRFGDIIHITAVDEPKVKPLLERLKTEYVV